MALAKTIVIHETGEVFLNVVEAAKSLDVHPGTLGQHINGKRPLRCLEGLTIYAIKEYNCRLCGIDLDDSNWIPSSRKQGSQICRNCHVKETYKSKDRDPLRKRARRFGIKTVRILVEKYPTCPLCGYVFRDLNFEVDHDVPISRGGSDNIENLQLLCHKCNKGKDALTTKEYIDHCRRVTYEYIVIGR